MIERYTITIDSIEDYQKLRPGPEDNSSRANVLRKYIDNDIIDNLSRFLGDDCGSIVVDYPYHDSDFLSNHYEFYDKKFEDFSKKCCRLLFFQEKGGSEGTEETCLGYMSLRPLTYPGRRIGRTFLDPGVCILKEFYGKWANGGQPWCHHQGVAYLITSQQKIHAYGKEHFITSSPHMSQEGDITVCAHIALWSVIRNYSNRFHMYPEVRVGSLVQMIQPEAERLIPSHGLTARQICKTFFAIGMSPIFRFSENGEAFNGIKVADEALTYIESGIPIVCIDSKNQHAVAGFGRGPLYPEELNVPGKNAEMLESLWENSRLQWTGMPEYMKVYLAVRLIEEIVVNDDNFFPYRFLPVYDDTGIIPSFTRTLNRKNKVSAERECESLEKNYDGVIVPLYPKIQIVYNDVLEFFKGYVEQGLYSGTDEIVVRVFLTSGNTFREYVREETDAFERYMPGYTDFLLRLEMPRFVWVVETATCRQYLDGYISSFMLLDSTSSTVNPSPAIHFFQVADSGSDESIIPRFKHNLKEYGRKLQ